MDIGNKFNNKYNIVIKQKIEVFCDNEVKYNIIDSPNFKKTPRIKVVGYNKVDDVNNEISEEYEIDNSNGIVLLDNTDKLERIVNMLIDSNKLTNYNFDKRGFNNASESESVKYEISLSDKLLYISRIQDAGQRNFFHNNPIKNIPFKYNEKCSMFNIDTKFSKLLNETTINYNKFSKIPYGIEILKEYIGKSEEKETTELYNKLLETDTFVEFPYVYQLTNKNVEIFKSEENKNVEFAKMYSKIIVDFGNLLSLLNNDNDTTQYFEIGNKIIGIYFISLWIFHFIKDNIENEVNKNLYIQLYGYMFISILYDNLSALIVFYNQYCSTFEIDKNRLMEKIPTKYIFLRHFISNYKGKNNTIKNTTNNRNLTKEEIINKIKDIENRKYYFSYAFYDLLRIDDNDYNEGATYNIYDNYLNVNGDIIKRLSTKTGNNNNTANLSGKFPIQNFFTFCRENNINPNIIPLLNIYDKLYDDDKKNLKENINNFIGLNLSFVSSVKIYENLKSNLNNPEYKVKINEIKDLLKYVMNNICSDKGLLRYILKIFYHKENNDIYSIFSIIDEYLELYKAPKVMSFVPIKLLIVSF